MDSVSGACGFLRMYSATRAMAAGISGSIAWIRLATPGACSEVMAARVEVRIAFLLSVGGLKISLTVLYGSEPQQCRNDNDCACFLR